MSRNLEMRDDVSLLKGTCFLAEAIILIIPPSLVLRPSPETNCCEVYTERTSSLIDSFSSSNVYYGSTNYFHFHYY